MKAAKKLGTLAVIVAAACITSSSNTETVIGHVYGPAISDTATIGHVYGD